jgi:hypothetical protein
MYYFERILYADKQRVSMYVHADKHKLEVRMLNVACSHQHMCWAGLHATCLFIYSKKNA